jgi:16S rRNA (guanine527-N7)-methyltransferase
VSVSEEAVVPPQPEGAVALFGDRLALAVDFVGHLATSGVERGLVGPREVPRLWDRHVLNCAALAPLLPPRASVVDVGSGAGLPGLVLAIARPDARVTLVEPLLRRVTWLREVVAALGLDGVAVERARAEDLRGRLRAEVVTARAVAPLDRLLGWTLPLLAPSGELLAIKGRSADAELAGCVALLRAGGAVEWSVQRTGPPAAPDLTTVVRVRVGPHGWGPASGRAVAVAGSSRPRSPRRGPR